MEENISLVVLVSSFAFFYSKITQLTLEQPSAQNVAACESQGKQRELWGH